MSVLTWRDVATPDLGPASQGIANATDSMNRAFASAIGTVDNFKDRQADAADRNILNRTLQYRDPTELAYAIANGNIVAGDGAHAHPVLLNNLHARVTDLLNNAQIQANTAQTQATTQGDILRNTHQGFLNTVEADRKANIDANAGPITQAQTMAANGDFTGAVNLLKSSTLKPEEQQSVLSALNTNTVNADSITKDQFNQAKEKKNYQDSNAADEAYKKITANAPNGPTARGQMLEAGKSMNAEAYAGLVARLKTQYPDIEASPIKDFKLSTEDVPGAGVSDLSQFRSKYGQNGTFSYSKDGYDPSQNTLGDVQRYQRDVMIPANKGKVGAGSLGSGAIGAYQQNYDAIQTYAPKVLGKDWQKVRFTPQVQDKLAEAQFEDAKLRRTDLQKIWTSLTPEEATQLRGMSWAEAAPIISAGESGSGKTAAAVTTAMNNRLRAFDVSSILGKTIADQAANGFVKDYAETSTDMANADNAGAVAAKLVGSRTELQHADLGNLTSYISDIMKTAHVTAPVAGSIVANSLAKTTAFSGGFLDRHILNHDGISGAALGGGFEVDRNVMGTLMKTANSPEIKQSAAFLNFAKETSNTLADAQKRFSDAGLELQKVAQARRGDPNNPQLKAAYEQAHKVYSDAYQAVYQIQNHTLSEDAKRQKIQDALDKATASFTPPPIVIPNASAR